MLNLAKAVVANQTPGGVLMFRFHRVAARISARFGSDEANAWIRAVTRFQGAIDEKLLRSALVAKDLAGIDAAIKSSGFGRIMRDLEKPLLRTAAAAGTASAQTLTKAGFKFQFNAVHPNVVLFARDQTAALVVGVTQDVKVAIRTVVALGAQQGLTIQQQARAIRSVVGLPPPWSGAPLRLGAAIRRGDVAGATARRLSAVDKQQIRSRIARGTVTEPFISSMQERYAKSLINRRALNIARTETLRAANFGQQESWIQAANQGALPADSRRFWIVTPDDRLSEEHAQIPAMNPDGRGLEELFETPDGPFMYPPSRPNCRCGIGLGVGTGGTPGQAPGDASLPPPLLGRDLSTDLPTYISLSSKESTAVAKQAGVKLTTRGTSATLRQQQTSAIMAQGAKDVQALGFDLSKLNLRMKGSSKITDSVFTPKPTGKGVEITLRNRSGAEWAELQSRNKIGNPPWSSSDDLAGAVHHEIGHALHHNAVGGAEWERLAAWDTAKAPEFVQQVSRFAARSPREFVGDVFSGLTSGKQYPANVLRLYEKLKGPVAPRWRKMFDDILGGKRVQVVTPTPPSAVAPPAPPPGAVPLKVSQGPIQDFISNPVRTPKEIRESFKNLGVRFTQPRRVGLLQERQTVEMLLQGVKDIEALGFDLRGIRLSASKNLGGGVTGRYTPQAKLVQLRVQPLNILERNVKRSLQEKWHPADSWMGTVHHELGHAIHHAETRLFYNKVIDWPPSGSLGQLTGKELVTRPLLASGRGRQIAREVSKYAQTNPHELVAEMFNGLVSGARYSDDVMNLYMELRGPIARQWRSRFEAVTRRTVAKKVPRRKPTETIGEAGKRARARVLRRKRKAAAAQPDASIARPRRRKKVVRKRKKKVVRVRKKKVVRVRKKKVVRGRPLFKKPAVKKQVRRLEGSDLRRVLQKLFPEKRWDTRTINAIRDWRGDGYKSMQRVLRNGRLPVKGSDARRIMSVIDDLIADSEPLGINASFWRGGRLPSNLKVGMTINDRGFTATSVNRKTAIDFITNPRTGARDLIRVDVQSGQQGLWVQRVKGTEPRGLSVSKTKSEAEFILPRDSRFRIVRIRNLTQAQFEREFGSSAGLKQFFRPTFFERGRRIATTLRIIELGVL